MILTNTKATGYSLGLALYWPEDPSQLSTGLIQGISISLLLDPNTPIPDLRITKYSVVDNHVSLSISDGDLFCSMEGDLSDGYAIYALESTSPAFLRGWVGLYPNSTDRLINLVGAKINPLYIHASIRQTVDAGIFCLRNGSQIVTSTSLIDLSVESTADVAVTSTVESGGIVYSASVNDSIIPAESVDSSSIYYVNGSRVSGGIFQLYLPEGWTVMGNELCARVGNESTVPSCMATDYITEELGPQNFAGNYNPLSVAFPDGSTLDMTDIYNGTTKFNAAYENGGLLWNEFSEQHDGAGANAD